jgi:hypothetical protein
MAHAATMDSAPSDGLCVIDFRRQRMFLRWQIAGGTWVACDVPPSVVHGVALIRASGPNICLFGLGGQLHLQVGANRHVLAGDALRITCKPLPLSLGMRKRFVVEDGTRIIYRHSYWTGQGDDFFRWLAARASSAEWRRVQAHSWSAGAPAAAVRAS